MGGRASCPLSAAAEEISGICARTFQTRRPDGRYGRTFHAPLIANLAGELEIHADLPAAYRLGLFARAARYPVAIRFSSSFFTRSYYPDARGLAIKVFQVDGPVLPGGPPAEHNITLLNQPTFIARDADDMLDYVRRMDGVKRLTPLNLAPPGYTFPGGNPFAVRWGFVKGLLDTLSRSLRGRDLARYDFFSVSPYRLGDTAMKYGLRPACPPLGQGKDLRQRLHTHLLRGPLVYDLLIQPRTLANDALDDHFQAWKSPFIPVGRLIVPRHDMLQADIFEAGEAYSYTPWHCLQAHEPLGSINALRCLAYAASAARRGARGADG